MQLATSGLRALRGHPAHSLGNPSRSIHTPSFLPCAVQRPTSGTSVQAIFRQAKTLLHTAVGHLTAPGTLGGRIPSGSRSLMDSAVRFPTIQQRMSSGTRFALARPLGAPFLPRAPAVPRSMFQVGLGTARNFSSARPLFDSFAQNVPVAGRAFWEADWDLHAEEQRKKLRLEKYQKKEQKKTRKEMLQPVRAARQEVAPEPTEAETRAELDRYFPAPVVADVTTYLLIPLAPTPSSRLPLAMSPSIHSSSHPLIPLSYLAGLHNDHSTHSLRVSTIFARLDQARVFEEPGVSTSAYGDRSGLCTVLEVKFAGWTEPRVRSVLGEAGTGWCVLEEVREVDSTTETDAMEDALSEFTTPTGINSPAEQMDPSASFVLPTLDFSASFAQETDSWARPTSPSPGLADLEFHNAWSAIEHDNDTSSDGLSDISDSLSDVDMDGSVWGSSPPLSRRSSFGSVGGVSSRDGWTTLGFSSSFAGRLGHDTNVDGPREEMF